MHPSVWQNENLGARQNVGMSAKPSASVCVTGRGWGGVEDLHKYCLGIVIKMFKVRKR